MLSDFDPFMVRVRGPCWHKRLSTRARVHMRSEFPKPLAQMQVDRILAQAKHDARQHSGLEDYGAAEVSSPDGLNAERLEHPMEKVLFLEELEKVVHVSTSKSPNSLAVLVLLQK